MDLEPVSGEALPKRTLVESFRVVCWQFLIYQDRVSELPPVFDDCPRICHIYSEKDRIDKTGFCEGCEVKIAKESFEEEATAVLDERLGNKWKSYSFKRLLGFVYDAFDLKSSKEDMSLTSEIFAGILVSEQNRQRRIEDYNRKLQSKEQ